MAFDHNIQIFYTFAIVVPFTLHVVIIFLFPSHLQRRATGNMSTNIENELKVLLKKGVYFEKIGGSASHLLVRIPGPPKSPYEGTYTWWQLVFHDSHPAVAPALFSVTKHGATLPHPNLHTDTAARNEQRLCIAQLRDWPPGGRTLYEIINIIKQFLESPNWEDANPTANVTEERLAGLVATWAATEGDDGKGFFV